jgi:phosphoglycolate phosphatase-like HAD superfamily hydrolase
VWSARLASVARVLVAFDWNGTLVDDSEQARAATNEVLAHRGLGPLDAVTFSDRFTLPLSEFFARLGWTVPEWSRQLTLDRDLKGRHPGLPSRGAVRFSAHPRLR